MTYPRIKQIGLKVHTKPCTHVRSVELDAALSKAGLKREQFSQLFGDGQTCPAIACKGGYIPAMYPYDVEAVLERMLSGKLTGTQLFWD